MDSSNFIEKNMQRIARREVRIFRKKVKEFLTKDFPTGGPYNLAELFLTLSEEILNDISLRVKEMEERKEEDKEVHFLLPLLLLGYLHKLLQYIDKTETQENPYGILVPFENVIRHFKEEFEIVLRPQWDYMYSCREMIEGLTKLVDRSLHKGNELMRGFQKPFYILSYPAAHRNNALMHSIQGHEIGHFFDKAGGVSLNILGQIDPRRLEDLANSVVSQRVKKPEEPEERNLFYFRQVQQSRAHYRDSFAGILKEWLKEIVSDLFAINIFGPAYFFAAVEFFQTISSLQECNEDYPRGLFRIHFMVNEIRTLGFYEKFDTQTRKELENWESRVQTSQVEDIVASALETYISDVAGVMADEVRGKTKNYAFSADKFDREVPELVSLLENIIPPVELFDLNERKSTPADVMSMFNAGWIVYLTKIDQLSEKLGTTSNEERVSVDEVLNRLIFKAIEVSDICKKFPKETSSSESSHKILDYLYEKNLSERLLITPILSPKRQLGDFSVDLRLGSDLIIPKRTRYPVLDSYKEGRYSIAEIEQYQEKVYVGYGKHFVLHPNQFALGCTMEYLRLPPHLSAYVIGRSSWGRLGLTIATATSVAPGFTGSLVLELVNHGEAPIVLYPGTRIAQLIFHEQPSLSKEEYIRKEGSKYIAPIGSEFSLIYKDKDWQDLEKSGYLRPWKHGQD